MKTALKLKHIQKYFFIKTKKIFILENINLCVNNGEIIALIGASGVGKSTLLHIAGLLEKPSAGTIYVDNEKCIKPQFFHQIRNQKIGFIYQSYNLLSELNVIDNIALPLLIRGVNARLAKEKAEALLIELNLTYLKNTAITYLSGGEKQRLAICRALITEPKIILADEPTGSLDPDTTIKVFSFLLNYLKKRNIALLIATHNYQLAAQVDKIYALKNKGLLEISPTQLLQI